MDMCELGFHSLSISYCPIQGKKSTENMDQTVSLSPVLYSGKVGRVVPMVMVVHRREVTYAWSFQIMSYSQFHYPVLCII
jgi:hypothetical protein